jgi:two-component system, OmpR family, sensor kinase
VPLRLRVALVVATASGLLVLLSGLLFVRQLQTGLLSSVDAGLRARADSLSQRLGPDGNGDFQDGGADALLPPGEALAQVIGRDGRLLQNSDGAARGPMLDAQQLTDARVGSWRGSISYDGRTIRVLAVPLEGSAGRSVVVVVGTSLDVVAQTVAAVRRGIAVSAGLAVLLAGFGAWLLTGFVLRPVERMSLRAAHISAENSGERLPVPSTRDEVARLGHTMNELLTRLDEALERQRLFVADAGHELRTPMAVLTAELELAGRPGRSRQELVDAVTRAEAECHRISRLTEDLLLLARADTQNAFLEPAMSPLRPLLEAAAHSMQQMADTAGVRVRIDRRADPVVEVDVDRLRQCVDNILVNALRYAPSGSEIVLLVDRLTSDGADWAVIEVRDRGPGFPPSFLPHAFERFRRADTARSHRSGGLGLGLAITEALTRAQGGRVGARNRRRGGACVRIELPTQPVPEPSPVREAGLRAT